MQRPFCILIRHAVKFCSMQKQMHHKLNSILHTFPFLLYINLRVPLMKPDALLPLGHHPSSHSISWEQSKTSSSAWAVTGAQCCSLEAKHNHSYPTIRFADQPCLWTLKDTSIETGMQPWESYELSVVVHAWNCKVGVSWSFDFQKPKAKEIAHFTNLPTVYKTLGFHLQ